MLDNIIVFCIYCYNLMLSVLTGKHGYMIIPKNKNTKANLQINQSQMPHDFYVNYMFNEVEEPNYFIEIYCGYNDKSLLKLETMIFSGMETESIVEDIAKKKPSRIFICDMGSKQVIFADLVYF